MEAADTRRERMLAGAGGALAGLLFGGPLAAIAGSTAAVAGLEAMRGFVEPGIDFDPEDFRPDAGKTVTPVGPGLPGLGGLVIPGMAGLHLAIFGPGAGPPGSA